MPAGVRLGVDIGGTFTDIVLTRPDGTVLVSKVSSTPDDPGRAVVTGVDALLRAAAIAPAEVVEGGRTGLLTTRGFRDVLEIGRIRTPELFDLTWEKPMPLVERRWRMEVDERMGADGRVVRPLDLASVTSPTTPASSAPSRSSPPSGPFSTRACPAPARRAR
jgi:N-methylhydantoinase A